MSSGSVNVIGMAGRRREPPPESGGAGRLDWGSSSGFRHDRAPAPVCAASGQGGVAKNFLEALVQHSGTRGEVQYREAAADAIRLPETGAQSLPRNADLLRCDRRARRAQHVPERGELDDLCAQPLAEARPDLPQAQQLTAHGFPVVRLGPDLFRRDLRQFSRAKLLAHPLRPTLAVRPCRTAARHVESFERTRQHPFVQRRDRQRPHADFESVRGWLTLMRVMLHVPEMTELMFRAGRGPARTHGLHRKSTQHQSFDQVAQRDWIARPDPRRRATSLRRRPCTISHACPSIGSTSSASATIQSAPAVILASKSA